MRARPLRGQVGGGWAHEFETFLGPVKWHRAVRPVAFWAQQSRDFQPPPISPNNGFACIKSITYRSVFNQRSIGSFMNMSVCILYSVFLPPSIRCPLTIIINPCFIPHLLERVIERGDRGLHHGGHEHIAAQP
jgi:hypothetical protein